jgi:hypothetical protein
MVRRDDLEKAKTALGFHGFIYRHAAGIHFFLDGPGAKARDAVHVLFAGEKVRPEYVAPAPDVSESESTATGFHVLKLDALVTMKLTSFRRKDQVHILDLINIGLVDASWKSKYPAVLADRLQHLLDTPEG